MIPALLVLLAVLVFGGFMAAVSWVIGHGIDPRTSELVSNLCAGGAFVLAAIGFAIPLGLVALAAELLKGGAA